MTEDYKQKLNLERFEKEKEYIHDHRNELESCPYCESNIKDRKVALYKELINNLYQIYCWCGKNRKHEFKIKDIRHLIGKIEYTRFNNLVRFGGIVYKPKIDGKSQTGLFGINMKRAKEFFSGRYDIPVQIVLDQITNEIISEVRCNVKDFPSITSYINSNGFYDYELPVQNILL